MVSPAVAQRLGRLAGQARDHDQLVAERRERRQNRRELEARADALWQPFLIDDAVGMVDDAQPADGLRRGVRGGRERRNHGVEQRQGHRRPEPSKNGTTRQDLPGDRHDPDLLIWNGVLLTIDMITEDHR